MLELLQNVGLGFLALTGIFVWFSIFRPIKGPKEGNFDTSNRINRLILLWICLTRPWKLKFRFLTMDVGDQIDELENNGEK